MYQSRRQTYPTKKIWNPRTKRYEYPRTKRYNKYKYQSPQQIKAPTAQTTQSAIKSTLTTTPIFPARKYLNNQLYYEGRIRLQGASGVPSTYWFSANGLYDPNISGTGHQPIGFDTMMSLYEHYAVLRSKITVTLNSNTFTVGPRVAVYLSPDAVALSDPSEIMENGLIATTTLETKESGTAIKSLNLNCDVKKYFAKKRYLDIIDDEKLTGTATGNPVEGVYFGIVTWNPFDAVATDVYLDVVLSYDSVYYEPRKLIAS